MSPVGFLKTSRFVQRELQIDTEPKQVSFRKTLFLGIMFIGSKSATDLPQTSNFAPNSTYDGCFLPIFSEP